MFIDRKDLIRTLSHAAKFTGDPFAAESLRVIRLSVPDGSGALDVWASNGHTLFMDSLALDTMTHFRAPVFIHVDQIKPILAGLRALKSAKLEIMLTVNGLTFGSLRHMEQYTAPLYNDVDTMPWDAMVDLAAGAEAFSGSIPVEGMPFPVQDFIPIMQALAAYTSNDAAPMLCKVLLPGIRKLAAFRFTGGALSIICMTMRTDADNPEN